MSISRISAAVDPDLDLEAILDHLAGVSVFADEDFAGHGLDEPRIADLRSWSQDGMTISPAVSPRSSPTMNFRTTCDSARDMNSAPSVQSQVDNVCHYRLHEGESMHSHIQP